MTVHIYSIPGSLVWLRSKLFSTSMNFLIHAKVDHLQKTHLCSSLDGKYLWVGIPKVEKKKKCKGFCHPLNSGLPTGYSLSLFYYKWHYVSVLFFLTLSQVFPCKVNYSNQRGIQRANAHQQSLIISPFLSMTLWKMR